MSWWRTPLRATAAIAPHRAMLPAPTHLRPSLTHPNTAIGTHTHPRRNASRYGIKPELEVIEPSYIHRVFEMLNKSNDAGLRYVIDCSKLTPDLLSSYESAPPNFE